MHEIKRTIQTFDPGTIAFDVVQLVGDLRRQNRISSYEGELFMRLAQHLDLPEKFRKKS